MKQQPDPIRLPDNHLPSGAHITPVPYHQGLRGASGAWRGILALVVLLAVAYVLLAFVVTPLSGAIDFARGAAPRNPEHAIVTPGLLLANNLLSAALIPTSMLLQWALFGIHPRWLLSVVGHVRWRWLGRLATVLVPLSFVTVAIAQRNWPSGTFRLDRTVVGLLALALLTTPLQAAGEEFVFRGLAQRAIGSWLRGPRASFIVSTAITAPLFAAIHRADDPWLAAYQLAAGASLSTMTHLSGGLEASILLHATNNTLLLLPVILTGRLAALADRTTGPTGPALLFPIATALAAPLLVRWLAGRHGIVTAAPPPPSRFGGIR